MVARRPSRETPPHAPMIVEYVDDPERAAALRRWYRDLLNQMLDEQAAAAARPEQVS